MTTTNGGGTYPSRFARHQLDSIVRNDEQEVNEEDFMVDENEIGETFEADEIAPRDSIRIWH